MASFFEQSDRNVIPNWRSFANTTKLGEINGLQSPDINKAFKPDMSNLIDDWELEENIGIAAELVSFGSAFKISNPTITQASSFILKNIDKSSRELINIAQALTASKIEPEKATLEITTLETFNDFSNLSLVFSQIQKLKQKLIHNPRNAIAWVDLSRYYSILGQNVQARRSMMNAIHLSPNNRFVLRSMARFFAHNDEIDLAHDIIKKQDATKFDPWLVATEISLASLRERNSVLIKTGVNFIESQNTSLFNLSEVSSAIGTVELLNGNHKRSKKLFQFSLQEPNDNALAQAEWANQKNSNRGFINVLDNAETNSFEASARSFYERKLWQQSLNKSVEWFLDLPFSKSPIVFGSHIARTHLNDHKKAIELGRIGLISHPHDVILINNLIYSLCCLGELEEANSLITKNESLPKSEQENIYWMATKGLYYFRKGFYDVGRNFYLEAIALARKSRNRMVFNLAVVHYTHEEVRIKSTDSAALVNQLDELLKGEVDAAVLKTKDDVMNLFLMKDGLPKS